MKKLLNKISKYFLIGSIFASSFVLFSCQDPIFSEIRNEVQLEKGTIFGDVYSIVRVGDDKIFTCNGYIFSKDKNNQSHGSWSKVNTPPGTVLKLAVDKNYIYALSYTYTENTSEGEMEKDTTKLYYSADEGKSWNLVKTDLNFSKPVNLFCTNSIKKDHRIAFFNYEGKVYDLNGEKATPNPTSINAKSCVWTDSASATNNVEFFDAAAVCSNETETSNATEFYYSLGGAVYKTTTNQAAGKRFAGAGGSVQGITYTKDSLFVATTSGALLISLKPENQGSDIPFVNLASTLSSLYQIQSCLAVDPSKNAIDTPIYSGIGVLGTGSNSALFTHEGLWSYYPVRGKWNIE